MQCRRYNDLLSKTKKDFYREKIQTSSQHYLFKLVNKLSSPTAGSATLPSTDSPVQLANRFADFFSQKIVKLRDKLMLANSEDLSIELNDQCQSRLHVFQEVSEEDVDRIIKSSSSSTCKLDPEPTTLSKRCNDELLPVLTTVVNASWTSGIMPCLFKKAIVTPFLKKAGASQEDLKNYRPVSNFNFFSKVIEKVATIKIMDYLTENNLHVLTQSAYKNTTAWRLLSLTCRMISFSPLTSDRRPSWFCWISPRPSTRLIIPLCWTDLVYDMDLRVVF